MDANKLRQLAGIVTEQKDPAEKGVSDAKVLAIAKKHFSVETLDTRNRDHLDFHEVSVWSMKAAIAAAYSEGYKDGYNSKTKAY